jgi:hypothetical protein
VVVGAIVVGAVVVVGTVVVVTTVVVEAQPVWAGLLLPIPLFRSHSYPALWSLGPGCCPGGFLLSALPTQPAHGLPTALPFPFPLRDGLPLRVDMYGIVVFGPGFAPFPLRSAFE